MNKSRAILFLLVVIATCVQAGVLSAKVSSPEIKLDTLSWDATLPFDPGVKRGALPNGFQYFIRRNGEPKARVTMYLATKVGSILETDEQVGLAHFLEHMNFNGLKHFPKNELVDYLQKVGVRFGSDLNAYTSFDQTVYQLPIPSDDPELLKNGLQVLRDWAQDALLMEDEIDKERGVVLEELRGRKGVQQRMLDQYLPYMLNHSLYAKRLPIGTEENLKNFPYDQLRKFHQDWYRPDLQALIIVGDIDVAAMESEIKRLFSDLKTPENKVERKEYTVDLLDKNQFVVVTDPEMSYISGTVTIKHKEEKVKTVRDYRKEMLKSLYGSMLNARLGELSQSANPPFVQAGVGIGGMMGNLDSYSAFVQAKPGAFEDGFEALLREIQRVKLHGFTDSEFARAVAARKKNNESSYIERDKAKSDSYVRQYLGYYIEESPVLGSETRYELTNQLLPTLTLAEVNAIGKEYYVDNNRDIVIMAPDNERANLPNEQQVNQWLAAIDKEAIKPYEDNVSSLAMLSQSPVAGKVASAKSIDAIQTKELTLSNGVRVLLKPTDFKNDEILISAQSPGGTSLYTDEDFFSAAQSASLVNSSGVGQYNAIELQKYLSGKKVNISPYIAERSEGLSGNTDKEGLKTAFELIYGYFTAPRIEPDAFESFMTRSTSMIANREGNPNYVFYKTMQETLYPGSIRRKSIEKEDLAKIKLDRSLAIYKERFADASDFTFTIVGSFTEEQITPYLEQYLASLPALNRNEQPKDLGLYEPKIGVTKVVNKGKEQKANATLTYYGDYTYNDVENLNMKALESVLSIKLLERLREEESGVYGTGARVSTSKYPKNRFNLTVSFGTAVDKYESLIASALDEIRKVKENGPLATDIEKFKIEQKRQLELSLKENGFWLGRISSAYQREEDPAYVVTQFVKDLDNISVESIKEVANKYLLDKQLFKFILLPDAVN